MLCFQMHLTIMDIASLPSRTRNNHQPGDNSTQFHFFPSDFLGGFAFNCWLHLVTQRCLVILKIDDLGVKAGGRLDIPAALTIWDYRSKNHLVIQSEK